MMRGTAHEQRLLSAAEVADHLAVPLATVYSWRRRGLGPPSMMIGKHLRYAPEDVRAWLDERKAAS